MHNFAAVLLVTMLAMPAPAGAQTGGASEAAMASWNHGVQLFNRAHYAEAMKAFARGYELSHKPGFLFNMAECARLMGDEQNAHRLYVRYLAEHTQGKLRAEAQRRCEELAVGPCQAASATLPARAVDAEDIPAVSTTVSRPAPTATPTPAPYLPPGQPAPASAARRPFYKRWPLWVGVGLVVVGGTVTAAVLGSRAGRSTPDANYVVDLTH